MEALKLILQEILEDFSLTTSEKMFLIAVRCLEEEGGSFSFAHIAKLMGTTDNDAKLAFIGLKHKGYIDSITEKTEKLANDEHIERLAEYLSLTPDRIIKDGSKIIKSKLQKNAINVENQPLNEEFSDKKSKFSSTISDRKIETDTIVNSLTKMNPRIEDFDESDFIPELLTQKPDEKVVPEIKSVEQADKKIPNEAALAVMNMIQEDITLAEAKIILGFAGGDLRKIEEAYSRIRKSQITDKLDALVSILQSKQLSDERIPSLLTNNQNLVDPTRDSNIIPANKRKISAYKRANFKEL